MDKLIQKTGTGIFSIVLIMILFICISMVWAANDRITVAEFASDVVTGGAPEGWVLEKKQGTPDLKLEKANGQFALHMKSDSESSFGITKEIKIKKGEYPLLNWKWKVNKLPAGGDVRKSDTDDQALQIYIAFEETGWPAKLKTPVLGYIWDNECPKETKVTSPQPLAGKVRYVVIRDKTDKLAEWYTEKRNIYDDFKTLFPDIDDGSPRNVKGISFYINSQHTKSDAESFIYDVYFSKD